VASVRRCVERFAKLFGSGVAFFSSSVREREVADGAASINGVRRLSVSESPLAVSFVLGVVRPVTLICRGGRRRMTPSG